MKKVNTFLITLLLTTSVIAQNNYYFGNLHSHSGYSDGNKDDTARTPAYDYQYAKNSLCMDFLGISEHNHRTAGMHVQDYPKGLAEARAATQPNFLALYGMEWGVSDDTAGHVMIYGSNQLWGWETGNYDVYTAKKDYISPTGLFAKVNNTPTTFATLAHPSDGQFDSIYYRYNAAADAALVGSAVESGPAFSTDSIYTDPPSYMYYLPYWQRLLANGYHVAPLIDHDNHYTTFGRTATSRLVIIAPTLDSAGFYTAMKSRHFYATQDCDTRLDLTVNNEMMGSIIAGTNSPAIVITAHDPTSPSSSALVKLMKGTPGSGINPTEIARTVGVAGILTFSDTTMSIGQTAYYYADVSIAGKRSISAPVWYTKIGGAAPVKLLSFTAKGQSNQTVRLNWQTSNEVNNKEFIIERSGDGVKFNPINTTRANPNSSGEGNYFYTDLEPLKSLNYYRLKQVDKDGQFTYSKVQAVNFNTENINSFSITPNPAASLIHLQIHSIQNQQAQITVTDISGKKLFTQSVTLVQGNQTSTLLDLPIAQGTYFITLSFFDSNVTEKLMRTK